MPGNKQTTIYPINRMKYSSKVGQSSGGGTRGMVYWCLKGSVSPVLNEACDKNNMSCLLKFIKKNDQFLKGYVSPVLNEAYENNNTMCLKKSSRDQDWFQFSVPD